MINTTDVMPAHYFSSLINIYKKAVVDVEAVCPDEDNDAYDAEVDAKVDVMFAITNDIMNRGAPTIDGAIAKLEIALYRSDCEIRRDHIESVLADFMRLTNVSHSLAMVPLEWLCQFERVGGVYDHHPDTNEITLSANFDKPAAINMVQRLSKQERATLSDYIRGTKA